ncbi:MAG: matrixin family metalloprotease [Candidatus Brocadiae bacterium]|nr:matrixin family metalloprotease [Candidatus Brocadiia bacterium]
MKRKLTLAALLASAGFAGAWSFLDSPPPKWGGSPTGSGSGGEVTFFMNEAGTADVPGLAEGTMIAGELAEWDAATSGALDLEYGGTIPVAAEPGDGLNVIDWRALGPGIGAGTFPMYVGGEMLEADIQMNSDMDWSDPVFLENVLLHELGHAVGMDHEDGVTAVMNSVVMGTTELQPDDVAGIVALYGTGGGSDGTGGGAAPHAPTWCARRTASAKRHRGLRGLPA